MNVVVLSGGVGGARFADGVVRALSGERVTIVVNTGDDFAHLGLWIAPDLDTVMYTLAGVNDDARGWGLAGETFDALSMLTRYGGPGWFALGDRDLATHLVRTEALRNGETLTQITANLCTALGVTARVLPMTDAPRATMIDTVSEGTLAFQDWLVRHRGEPEVRAVRFEGEHRPSASVLSAIASCDLVLVGPSNPYVSIDPILTLEGVREALSSKCVIAVSPIALGRAIKGPLSAMIPSLAGEPASAAAIARHYRGLISGLVVERGDEGALEVGALATDIVMRNKDDRLRLARETIEFARGLAV